MYKSGIIYGVFIFAAMLAFSGSAMAEGKHVLDLKVGDERYVCNCGPQCECNTISKKEGDCTCGHPMVKAKVVAVAHGTANFMAEGWDEPRTFKTVGKYVCNCPKGCDCNTISQHPGKCVCGVEMKKVE